MRRSCRAILLALIVLSLSGLARAGELKVGDKAPDFTLMNTSWKKVSLHDFLGKKSVVLAFYVLAFTGG